MTILPAWSLNIRLARCWMAGYRHQNSGAAFYTGRYFQVAQPGLGWGGTDIEDPLTILGPWNAKKGAKRGCAC